MLVGVRCYDGHIYIYIYIHMPYLSFNLLCFTISSVSVLVHINILNKTCLCQIEPQKNVTHPKLDLTHWSYCHFSFSANRTARASEQRSRDPRPGDQGPPQHGSGEGQAGAHHRGAQQDVLHHQARLVSQGTVSTHDGRRNNMGTVYWGWDGVVLLVGLTPSPKAHSRYNPPMSVASPVETLEQDVPYLLLTDL